MNQINLEERPVMISVKEFARLAQASESFIRTLKARPGSPPCYKIGKNLKFPKAACIKWLNERLVSPQ